MNTGILPIKHLVPIDAEYHAENLTANTVYLVEELLAAAELADHLHRRKLAAWIPINLQTLQHYAGTQALNTAFQRLYLLLANHQDWIYANSILTEVEELFKQASLAPEPKITPKSYHRVGPRRPPRRRRQFHPHAGNEVPVNNIGLTFIDIADITENDPDYPRYISLQVNPEDGSFTLLGNLPHGARIRPRDRASLDHLIEALQAIRAKLPEAALKEHIAKEE